MVIFEKIKLLLVKFFYRFTKKDKNLWVFGEWYAKKICDNSLYLANYVAENYPEIKLVWITDEGTDLSLLNPNIQVMIRKTKESKKILKKASVIIVNQCMFDVNDENANYYGGSLVLNLWHGVPWKKILMDAEKYSSKFRKLFSEISYRYLGVNNYIALSDDYRDILKRCTTVKDKNIINAGYPRNSLFYDEKIVAEKREKVVKLINETFNQNFSDVKIITYMPTFRDKDREVFSFNQIKDNENLNKILAENNAIIVEKSHFKYSENSSEGAVSDKIFNINNISAQELLAASDMLITDYSSCFFDFLILDRPIIHYLYDYEYYVNDDRGVYYQKEEVCCGDVAEKVDELINYIALNLEEHGRNRQLREIRKEKFIKYESSDSCQIICDYIFNKIGKK